MRSAQLVRSDDGGVEDLRRRKGETDECDHSHLESSTTAQKKIATSEPTTETIKDPSTPGVGKERKHDL